MATTKLTDTHLVILSQAAQRPKARVLPTPESLKADAGAVTRALKALLKRGLIAEQQARKSDPEWRRDESGSPLTLVVTPAGLEAIGLADHGPNASSHDGGQTAQESNRNGAGKQGPAPGGSSNTTQRPGTKGAEITALLKRNSGATLDELTAASGWQAHSVRGFLSGTLKKKLGLTVTSERGEDGVRRYRIAA
jgi:Protein of unknown function (DUF3489)